MVGGGFLFSFCFSFIVLASKNQLCINYTSNLVLVVLAKPCVYEWFCGLLCASWLKKSFPLFLVCLGRPRLEEKHVYFIFFSFFKDLQVHIYIYIYIYMFIHIHIHISITCQFPFSFLALAEICLEKGERFYFHFIYFGQVLKPTFQSSINAHHVLYFLLAIKSEIVG